MKRFVSLCNLNFSENFHVSNRSLLCSLHRLYNLLSECFTCHFGIQYLRVHLVHLNKCDIEYVTSLSFDCDSKLKTFVTSQYSCTIYLVVCLNDFIHLLWRIQTHCLLCSLACFWSFDSWLKIFWAHQPLQRLLSFLYFNGTFAN